MKKYITVPDMAKKVNLATVTAYKWVQNGKIPSETILGKIAINVDQIECIAKMVAENSRIAALRGGAA